MEMVNSRQRQIDRGWFGLTFGFQIGFVVSDSIVRSKGSAQRIVDSWGTLREIGSILMDLETIGHACFFRQGLPIEPDRVCRERLFESLHHPCSLLVEVPLALYQSPNFTLVEV